MRSFPRRQFRVGLALFAGCFLAGAATFSARGQEGGEPPARSVPRSSPAATTTTPPASLASLLSDLDKGQETPSGPVTPAPGPDPYRDGPRSSGFLLDDFFGLHPRSFTPPVSFYVSNSQFSQGVATGGARQAARWGSKFDMLAHVDSEAAGLWAGGMFDLFVESRLGQSIDSFAATYSPTNLAMFFPVPDEQVTAITGLKFTQALGERGGLFFGKLNALNGDREKFLKYPLTSRFWNAAFNFNLALDRYPYSTPGAGGYFIPERGPALAFLVLDSHNAPRTSGLDRLGENGVFLYTEAKQTTTFLGLPGKVLLAGLYGSGKFADLDPASFVDLPTGAPGPRETGTWTLLASVDQALWVDPANPQRGLGLYVQTGLGDGNPNPIRWFLSGALMGNSPLTGREYDTFGLGFYQIGLGSAVKSLAPGLRDEPGIEVFYNMRLAPGCHLTPDLQVIRPGLGPFDTALVLGLRLKLDF